MALRSTVGLGGGGAMYSAAISPHDPSLMFICCDMGGLYRSHVPGNLGAEWRLVDTRQIHVGHSIDAAAPPARRLPPNRLAFDPNPGRANVVLAASSLRGLRISTDYG